ncbi:cation transporter [uncultured Solobacterium sp.]|uniref:P-type ATPase n=1 Tax=uncultured Solobacterium sp. TaxID=747375 RepID=UPI0028E2EEBA|nr:cation transporter [uncultured Solobacterium sp.]
METIRQTFSVANLYLNASADTIYQRLMNTQGIVAVTVALSDRNVTVEFDPSMITADIIIAKIKACGYQAYTREIPTSDMLIPQDHKVSIKPNYRILFVFVVEIILLAILWIMHVTPWIGLIFSLYSLYVGRLIFMHAKEEIQKRNPSSATIGSIAVVITFLYGIYLTIQNTVNAYPFVISMIVILGANIYKTKYLKYMQQCSSTSLNIKQYIPENTAVFNKTGEVIEETSQLKKNQILIIRPNENIPCDGIVVEGYASVDESTLTGVQSNITKSEGSYVYAGTRCLQGSIQIKVEKIGEKTTLLQFAKLAKETANDKSFDSPFKNFSKYLFLYSIIAAIILFFGWILVGKSFSIAISISVAVLASVAMNALTIASEKEVLEKAIYAAKNHVLFRNVDALEIAGKAETLFLEQDDVLIASKPEVTDFIPVDETDLNIMRYIAYTLSNKRHDSYSRAINRYLKSQKISSTNLSVLTNFQKTHPSDSIQSTYKLCNIHEFLNNNLINDSTNQKIDKLKQEGKTVFILVDEKQVIGLIAAQKPVVPNSLQAISSLKEIIDVHLFARGNTEEIQYIQDACGIQNIHANVDMNEKENLIKSCSHDSISMYASADGSSSSSTADVNVQFGIHQDLDSDDNDIILTRKRLSDLVFAIQTSAKLNQQIQFKQIAIIIYHVLAVVLFGFITPIFFDIPLPAILPCITSIYVIRFLFQSHD